MGYVVIESFVDMSDNNYEYRVGDVYPRCGTSIIPRRVEELSGAKNRLKRPLIRLSKMDNKDIPSQEIHATETPTEPRKRGYRNRKREQE